MTGILLAGLTACEALASTVSVGQMAMKTYPDESEKAMPGEKTVGGVARSFRGVWIATVYDPRFAEDLTKKTIDEIKCYWRSILDAAGHVNVNAVFFQVRPCADGWCITLTWRHPVPGGGHSKAAFSAVFRGAATHPEIVTDKTSATLKNYVGETFRIVALDRLQNASPPAFFCHHEPYKDAK